LNLALTLPTIKNGVDSHGRTASDKTEKQFSVLVSVASVVHAFSALTLLVGQQEGHPASKN